MHDLLNWRKQFAREIVGEAPRFVEALENVRRVSPTDTTVVLSGETGTGKELFARAIHQGSSRRGRPFVSVNCAVGQDPLLETELFGHVKGAFTGATQPRAGRFQAANGGTLFLDEIGELSASAQAKLLRALEERVVTPVGSDTDIAVDIRVVVATHRNLEAMVREGRFRADLYFRLHVVPIELPALRDRGDDIDRITDVRIAKECEKLGRPTLCLEQEARALLRAHAWPGNVRELCNCIEHTAVLAAQGVITADNLRLNVTPRPGYVDELEGLSQTLLRTPRAILSDAIDGRIDGRMLKHPMMVPELGGDHDFDLRTAMESLEKDLIHRALSKAGGNRTEAAALLGLNRTTLVEKLRKYAR
jgi:transcriptional regulator with GAF, ATPase, and Fis domain